MAGVWFVPNTRGTELEPTGGRLEMFHLFALCLPIPPLWHFLLPVLSSVLAVGQMAVTVFELSLLT